MIDAAERDGELLPGGTIVEPTCGNTGVGLAIVAAQRGYNCIFVMTDKVGPEKVDLLRAYGAEVVVCPVAVAPEDPASYYSVAERLVDETPGAFRPNQYDNPVEPRGPLRDDRPRDLAADRRQGHPLRRRRRHRRHDLAASAATSRSRTPTSRSSPPTPRVRSTPAARVARTWSRGSARTSGPRTYDPDLVDRVDRGLRRGLVPHRPPGHPGGGHPDRRIGRHGRGGRARGGRDLTADDLVVVLIPDTGRGYLSKVFNDEWMAASVSSHPTDRRWPTCWLPGTRTCPTWSTSSRTDRAGRRAAHARARASRSFRWRKGEMPLATAEVMGSVDELPLMELAFDDAVVLDGRSKRS